MHIITRMSAKFVHWMDVASLTNVYAVNRGGLTCRLRYTNWPVVCT